MAEPVHPESADEDVDVLETYFFQLPVVSLDREDDDTYGGEWVTLHFLNGGEVKIYTQRPLMWMEPRVM
jgi:hypothetical protein